MITHAKRAVPVDEKLARGLTMVEVRRILKGGREAGTASIKAESHPVRAAFKPVAFRYATGRMPDPAYLHKLVEKFDAYYGAAAGTVFRHAETFPDQYGVTGEARRYLMLTPSTDDPWCRSLLASCVCLDVRAKCLTLNQVSLFEIELHAIERFHLRTRDGLVREALAAFGAALLRDVGLYQTMASYSNKLPNKAFAMPFADGLLLGHACEAHPAAVPPHAALQFFGDEMMRVDVPMTGDMHSCRVATFLGPLEMSPAQHELAHEIRAIAESRSDHLRNQSDALTYPPGLFERMKSEPLNYFDRFERQRRDVERDMRLLLERPGMERALGPGRTAPVVRPPARETVLVSRGPERSCAPVSSRVA